MTPAVRLNVRFGNAIVLAGFDSDTHYIRRGGVIEKTLYWNALRPIEHDYVIFVHLLNAEGRIIAQADHQPQGGVYPTSIWDAGEQVSDRFTIAVPEEIQPGNYILRIGWYDAKTGARLFVYDTNNQLLGDSFTLVSTLVIH